MTKKQSGCFFWNTVQLYTTYTVFLPDIVPGGAFSTSNDLSNDQ